jgi:drug/metabolite transporter (DMT)-like permease
VAGLGVGSTAVATIVYLYVIEKTGPSVIAKVNYFVPVASVALGVFFLSEPFTLRMVLAFAIILVGIIISKERKTPSVKTSKAS